MFFLNYMLLNLPSNVVIFNSAVKGNFIGEGRRFREMVVDSMDGGRRVVVFGVTKNGFLCWLTVMCCYE